MTTPKKNIKVKISADQTSANEQKKTNEKKILHRLHQKMKKAKAKKTAAEKEEKKAVKKLLDAEKKLEKANITKTKAEVTVRNRMSSKQAATEVFEAVKADYHALKDLPKGVQVQAKVVSASPATKPASAVKKVVKVKVAKVKVASVKKISVKKAST